MIRITFKTFLAEILSLLEQALFGIARVEVIRVGRMVSLCPRRTSISKHHVLQYQMKYFQILLAGTLTRVV